MCKIGVYTDVQNLIMVWSTMKVETCPVLFTGIISAPSIEPSTEPERGLYLLNERWDN